MDNTNILIRLEKRQLGFTELKTYWNDMLFENMKCLPEEKDLMYHGTDVGNTFACKFSKNKNNVHMLACSTEHGEVIIQNTEKFYDAPFTDYRRNAIHDNAVFNLAWAEPQMKLLTACGDLTSALCNLHPSGSLEVEKEFNYNSSVKSVMFCPGSSDIFCGGCLDGSIKVWDARVNNDRCVVDFDCNIPNAHCVFGQASRRKKTRKACGITCVIFKDDHFIMSCSSMDPYIKLWDIRRSYRQVKGKIEPKPFLKYSRNSNKYRINCGYVDMVMSPQSTYLYASGVDNKIDRYPLDTTKKEPIFQYSGHQHETGYSKISISNDGRYLFSGCFNSNGLIWCTDFPYNEKPMLKMSYLPGLISHKELSCSDWCADPTRLKLAASIDSMPIVWTVPDFLVSSKENQIIRTNTYKKKPFFKNTLTVPNSSTYKYMETYKNETEENMKNWDLHIERTVETVDLPLTPRKLWKKVFTKTPRQISPKSANISMNTSPVTSNQNSIVVTPTSSRKRKKSTLSPRSLIDQYLVPNSKREKLDTVDEI